MRTTAFLFAGLLLAASAFAQEVDSPANKRAVFTRDLGYFQQAGSSLSTGTGQGVFGLQYRTAARKPGYWLRAGAGFIVGTSYQPEIVRPLAPDTALSIFQYWNDRGVIAFVGLERERQFVPNIHLFVAGDVLLGYTAGRVDSGAVLRRYEANGTYSEVSSVMVAENVRTVRTGFGGLQASVGARAYYHRVAASLEVLVQTRVGMTRERNASVFDFSLGGLGYRLGIGYRF